MGHVIAFFLKGLPQAGVGFVVGAFCPAVMRRIKSAFVKKSSSLIEAGKTAVIDTVKKL